MQVQTVVAGAVTDTRASAATSEVRAATGASHVIEAAKKIELKTAGSRALTDHTSTSQDPRKASHG